MFFWQGGLPSLPHAASGWRRMGGVAAAAASRPVHAGEAAGAGAAAQPLVVWISAVQQECDGAVVALRGRGWAGGRFGWVFWGGVLGVEDGAGRADEGSIGGIKWPPPGGCC